jgi:hypothetical protein
MNALIWIIGMGLYDRMRGGGWCRYCHALGALGMGTTTTALLGVHGWVAVYVIVAVMLGATFGWGNPIGAALERRPMDTNTEWWQVGILRRSTLAALLFRGAMWGAWLAPLSLGAVAAFTAGFAAAPYLVRWALPLNPRIDSWAVMEFTRGAAIASLLFLVGK